MKYKGVHRPCAVRARINEAIMIPAPTKRAEELRERVTAFLNEHILPAEPVFERQLAEAADRWSVPPVIEELKKKARAAGCGICFCRSANIPTASATRNMRSCAK
jgi:acyl-CoA dehydrogenase